MLVLNAWQAFFVPQPKQQPWRGWDYSRILHMCGGRQRKAEYLTQVEETGWCSLGSRAVGLQGHWLLHAWLLSGCTS